MQESQEDDGSAGTKIGTALGKGRGVYATRHFAVGETVVEGRPVEIAAERTMTSFQKDWNFHVELDEPARTINHSCTPNTGIVDNRHGGYDFVAIEPIAVGDEVTWDYETTDYESISVSDCRCESVGCRGRTRGFRYREVISGHVAAYLRREPEGDVC